MYAVSRIVCKVDVPSYNGSLSITESANFPDLEIIAEIPASATRELVDDPLK